MLALIPCSHFKSSDICYRIMLIVQVVPISWLCGTGELWKSFHWRFGGYFLDWEGPVSADVLLWSLSSFSEGLAQTQEGLNWISRGYFFPILKENGLWRSWIVGSQQINIYSRFSHEGNKIGQIKVFLLGDEEQSIWEPSQLIQTVAFEVWVF